METILVRPILLMMKGAQVIVHESRKAGNFGDIDSIFLSIEKVRSVRMVITGIGQSEDLLDLNS